MHKKKILSIFLWLLIIAMSISLKPIVSKATQKIYTKEYVLNGVKVIETKEYTQAMVVGNGNYDKLFTISIKNKETSQLIKVDTEKESANLGWNYWYYLNERTDPADFVVFTSTIDSNGNFSDLGADERGKCTKVMGKYYSGCQKDYAEGMYDPAGHRKVENTKTQPQSTTTSNNKSTSTSQSKVEDIAKTNTTTDNKSSVNSKTNTVEEKPIEGELIKDQKLISTKKESILTKITNSIIKYKFIVVALVIVFIALLVVISARRKKEDAEFKSKLF